MRGRESPNHRYRTTLESGHRTTGLRGLPM